jgi:predicted porin
MRKSAIALAVTAGLFASAATYADTTFYGSFRTGVFMSDPDAPGTDATWGVRDEGSRWGVRGSEDLGNGLSATYQLEARVNSGAFNQPFGGPAFGGRLLWMGLEGGFGAARIGTQWTPYYIDVIGRIDQFNAVGDVLYRNSVMPFRANNAILYQTPASLDMFKFAAMATLDGGAGTRDFDTYNLGLSANFGPAGLGIAYLSNEVTDQDQFAVAADVSFAGAQLIASYESFDGDVDFFNVYGDYTFGNNIIRAHWGSTDPDVGDSNNDFGVGFQHNLSARTRVWAEYADLEDIEQQFSLGMRHDF